MFKVGDKVNLIDEDLLHEVATNNPNSKDTVGTVIEIIDYYFCIRVDWGDYINVYMPKHLALYCVPKNKLSEIVYPSYITSECGEYLIPFCEQSEKEK